MTGLVRRLTEAGVPDAVIGAAERFGDRYADLEKDRLGGPGLCCAAYPAARSATRCDGPADSGNVGLLRLAAARG